jgi:hypothetical protein
MPKKLHKGWLLTRVDKLPELATTREVSDATGYSMETLRLWLRDPVFRRAKIASLDKTIKRGRGNGMWEWHKDRLLVWVARVVLKQNVEINPPKDWSEHIPVGYAPQRNSDGNENV